MKIDWNNAKQKYITPEFIGDTDAMLVDFDDQGVLHILGERYHILGWNEELRAIVAERE